MLLVTANIDHFENAKNHYQSKKTPVPIAICHYIAKNRLFSTFKKTNLATPLPLPIVSSSLENTTSAFGNSAPLRSEAKNLVAQRLIEPGKKKQLEAFSTCFANKGKYSPNQSCN